MKRTDREVQDAILRCVAANVQLVYLTCELANLSNEQVQRLAQTCFTTKKSLSWCEEEFDREFNKRIKEELK